MISSEILTSLEDGTVVMCIGLGVVFSFLIITVFATMAMSAVVGYLNKIFPEAVAEPVAKKVVGNDEAIAVAVLAAKLKN